QHSCDTSISGLSDFDRACCEPSNDPVSRAFPKNAFRGGRSVTCRPVSPRHDMAQREGLPALTSLVVEKATGLPSNGLITVEFPAEQRRVFSFDWFSIFPPTVQELEA